MLIDMVSILSDASLNERTLKQMIDEDDIENVVTTIKRSDVDADLKDRPLLQYVNTGDRNITLLQYIIELGKVEMLKCLIHTRHPVRDRLSRRNRLVGYSELTYRNKMGETSIQSIFNAPLESIQPMWDYIQKRYKDISSILNWVDVRGKTPFFIALQNVIKCLSGLWSVTKEAYIKFMIRLVGDNRDTIYLSDYNNSTQMYELRKNINKQKYLIPYNLGNQLLSLIEVIDTDDDSTDDEEEVDLQLSGLNTGQAGFRFKF